MIGNVVKASAEKGAFAFVGLKLAMQTERMSAEILERMAEQEVNVDLSAIEILARLWISITKFFTLSCAVPR